MFQQKTTAMIELEKNQEKVRKQMELEEIMNRKKVFNSGVRIIILFGEKKRERGDKRGRTHGENGPFYRTSNPEFVSDTLPPGMRPDLCSILLSYCYFIPHFISSLSHLLALYLISSLHLSSYLLILPLLISHLATSPSHLFVFCFQVSVVYSEETSHWHTNSRLGSRVSSIRSIIDV